MSARSPRGSLSGASSAEVADDFGESLKDLQINNRYEISNLTIIAKENTEHAQAISKTLENHIKTTAPTRKLPALYVLDSIVKNVGTPYTVYLGRNLYNTFMDAYTLVDGTTRRNMEGMLKTWKEPVPGSMDTRPVFPLETVRPIENALLKAKTAALQSRPQAQIQPHQEYRNTPTPPQHQGRFGAPGQGQVQGQPYYGHGVQQPTPHQAVVPSNFSPAPNFQQSHLYVAPESRPVNDLESLKRDVAVLITQRQAESGANPFNIELQQQLQALRDLQNVLNSQSVDVHSLQLIRNQITALATKGVPQAKPTPQPNVAAQTQWQPPTSIPQPSHNVRPPVTFSQPHSITQPQPQASFIAPGILNSLQALLANGQKPGTPQIRAAAPALQNASHTQLNNVQNQAASLPALNANDLLASLAKNGLLPNLPNAVPTSSAPAANASQPQSTAALLHSLQSILPPAASQTGTPTQAPAQLPSTSRPRIPMTAASLKAFRPELVHALYDAQPNQCNTCGRRFLATEEGRAKKDRHLDWHFRTNQRMAASSISRGAHRDWFLPEMEWIQLSDFDPSTTTASDANAASNAAAAKKQKSPQDQYVRAPPGVTKNTCSICFEEMRASYSEELQEWVFTNATTHGGKIVHATCLAEMQKGQQGGSLAAALGAAGGQRQRSATPDSSLGKRKAEAALAGLGTRLRMD